MSAVRLQVPSKRQSQITAEALLIYGWKLWNMEERIMYFTTIPSLLSEPLVIKLLCCGTTYQHQSGRLTPCLCLRVDFLPKPIAKTVWVLLGDTKFSVVLSHRAQWSSNPPSSPELLCSIIFQHFRRMLLVLQSPPSWGLLTAAGSTTLSMRS